VATASSGTHSYALLDGLEISADFNAGIMEASKLVKLRNPWGIKAWEAEGWSSTSKKWTEQLTQEMAYQNNGVIDRGLFFVTL